MKKSLYKYTGFLVVILLFVLLYYLQTKRTYEPFVTIDPYTFDETVATPLCEIMGRHKSDKGNQDITNSLHNYTTFYHSIFKDMRDKPLRIFELGLGTNNPEFTHWMGEDGRPGASLYGWSEFFPNAQVFGADIDDSILFQTDSIKTYYCDQTNPDAISKMWNSPELHEPFDIIVDDGLHEYEANIHFFEHSIHKLAPNGYYIIEDVNRDQLPLFQQKVEEYKEYYPTLRFTFVDIPSTANRENDNVLLVVYRQS